MRKRYGLIAFAALVALDLLVKWAVLRSSPEAFTGGFGIAPLIGERDITAIFKAYPLAIKNVVLLTVVGFILFGYLAAGLLIPRSLGKLYFGFSVFLASLTANALDGALHSGVTSVFLIGSADHIRYHFNIADICTLVGFALSAYYFYKAIPLLFPSRSYQRTYWINPGFQTRYSLLVCALGFSYSLIIGLFSFSFLQALTSAAAEAQGEIDSFWMSAFVVCFAMITLLYLVALLVLVRRVTHSIAGPVYAFEKAVRETLSGKEKMLKLRDSDEFQELNQLAADINSALRKK